MSFGTSPTLRDDGYEVLAPDALARLVGIDRASLDAIAPSWNQLPPDEHLRDGGRYRFRRHASFELQVPAATLVQVPHRAHWQSVDYNALHGGIERWFAPVEETIAQSRAFESLVIELGRTFSAIRPATPWYVEAHQFRIDTASGIGRPTPEGAHRDGVDFVAVILIERTGVKGGETRVFEADGPRGVRFTAREPWTALLLDDTRVIHETTPIQQDGAAAGHRDTLVLTYRAGGFQAAT